MKFSDELIADVARTLQIAILTGTDIVDHLRTFEVEDESGFIKLTKDSKARIETEIEEIVEEVFAEAQEEGQDLDVFESVLCESIDVSMMLLNEVTSPAKVNAARLKNKAAAARGEGQSAGRDAGAEARKRLSSGSSGSGSSSRAEKLAKVKAAVKKVGAAVKAGVKKAAPVVRKAAVKSAEVAGKAAGHAKNLAKDMGSAAKKGYKSTQSASSSSSDSDSSSSSSSGGSSSSSGGSSSGMTRPVAKKKPGLLSRIGSKLKSGLKKAVGKTARAVSRGARNVARKMDEQAEPEAKEKEGPDAKEKQMLSQKKMMLNKQTMLQKKKLMLQKQGKLPMGGMNEENIEEAPKYDKEGNDKFDRYKRMIRHKQDKYGVSTLKQRLKHGGVDHNIDNEKKAKMKEETINERGDFWHPDPEKDRKLGGPGANQRAREDRAASKSSSSSSSSGKPKLKPGESYMQYAKRVKAMKTRKEEVELQEKELSIADQMRISREYNRKSPEEKKAANKKAMGNVKKVAPKKDTRTDAQKMTDATGPRPGSRYRGD